MGIFMRVEVSNFRMCFGARTVVEDLSFTVESGETFGFLGSNGSGKTTTLRVLLGMLPATGGRLLVGGRPFVAGEGAWWVISPRSAVSIARMSCWTS